MSSINLVAQPDRIIVATDTATWSMDGRIIGFYPKVAVLPHIAAALATRGPALAPPLFAYFLSRYRTFDALVASVERDMPEIHKTCSGAFQSCGVRNFDLIFAGYSNQRAAFEKYFLTTFPMSERGITDEEAARALSSGAHTPAPYTLRRLDDPIVISPSVDLERFEEAGLSEPFDDGGVADVLRDLTTVMEVQRRAKFGFLGAPERFHAVGGEAVATIITRTGVEQYVFHRWPEDHVGEMIRPEPIDWKARHEARKPVPVAPPALPVITMGAMSRQQRRYLERQNRKRV